MRLSALARCMFHLKCFAHYGYLGLILIGVIYHLGYVYLGWPAPLGLVVSGMAVGFAYWFLGGYGWLRLRWTRARSDIAQSNRPIGAVLLVVALWDFFSPAIFGAYEPMAVIPHVVGGAVAGTLAAIEMYEDPEIRAEMLQRRRAEAGA